MDAQLDQVDCRIVLWEWQYHLKDHLGNVRVTFSDADLNGVVDNATEIMEEYHYYPFGMQTEGNWQSTPSAGEENRYRYNGKELVEEFGLGWYDYGARFYDPGLGRFTGVDKLADHPNQVDKSPYAYAWNNPVYYTDPDGNCPNCITGAIGAGIGALFGGGIEIASQLYNNGSVSDWGAVGGSALQGGITGGAAGFTGGASLLTTAAVAGGANVVGGATNRAIQGQGTTVGDVVLDATIGGALGVGGKVVGNAVSGAVDDFSKAAKGKLGETLTRVKYGAKGYVDGGKAEVLTGGKTATGRNARALYDHAFENKFTGKQLTVESKFNTSGLTGNQRAATGNVTTSGGLIINRTTSQGVGRAAGAATSSAGAGAAAQKEREY